jgi:hypothetical protein
MRLLALGLMLCAACAGVKDDDGDIGLPVNTDPDATDVPTDAPTDRTDASDSDTTDAVTDVEPTDSDSDPDTDVSPTDVVAPTDEATDLTDAEPSDEVTDVTDEPEACTCSSVGTPVCAGGTEYRNACFARCDGATSWTVGVCEVDVTDATDETDSTDADSLSPEDSGCICTDDGSGDVCGDDGLTYASGCRAECAGRLWIEGPCTSEPDPGPCGCPTDWDPVCGVDGQDWTNACLATCAGMDFVDGACTQDTSWEQPADTSGDTAAAWTSDVSTDDPSDWSDVVEDTSVAWDSGTRDSGQRDTAPDFDTSTGGDTSMTVDTSMIVDTGALTPDTSVSADSAFDTGISETGLRFDTAPFDSGASEIP